MLGTVQWCGVEATEEARWSAGVRMFLCLLGGTCRPPAGSAPPVSTTPLPTRSDMTLLKALVTDKPTENHVTSPFLISMLMSQVWLGARGGTRSEVR